MKTQRQIVDQITRRVVKGLKGRFAPYHLDEEEEMTRADWQREARQTFSKAKRELSNLVRDLGRQGADVKVLIQPNPSQLDRHTNMMMAVLSVDGRRQEYEWENSDPGAEHWDRA